MTIPKIVSMTTSCASCSKRDGSICLMTDTLIVDRSIVAPFCPLPEYPAQVIANQQATIIAMRDPHKWGFCTALLTHVAMKIGQSINAGIMSVTIPYQRGGEEKKVCLSFDYISLISLNGEIFFKFDKDLFRLYIDSSPPSLSVQSSSDPNLWEPCKIIAKY